MPIPPPPPLPPRRNLLDPMNRPPPLPPRPTTERPDSQTQISIFDHCLYPQETSKRQRSPPSVVYEPKDGSPLAAAWSPVAATRVGICEGCFHSFFVPLGLGGQFAKVTDTGYYQSFSWECEFSQPVLLPAWAEVQQQKTLQPMIRYLSSLNLPPCPSAEPVGSCYELSPSIGDIAHLSIGGHPLVICERCYHRNVSCRYFEPHFVKSRRTGMPCSFAMNSRNGFSLLCAYANALDQRDLLLFLNAVRRISHYSSGAALTCPGYESTVLPTMFYVLKGVHGFNVCDSCYNMTLAAFPQLHGHVECHQMPHGMQGTFTCALGVGSARYLEIVNSLLLSYAAHDAEVFLTFARQLGATLPCQGIKMVSNGRWHVVNSDASLQGARICEDCYRQIIRPSKLASHFSATSYYDPQESSCDLFSQGMRAVYTDACEQNNFDVFARRWSERTQAYLEWCILDEQYAKQITQLENSIQAINQMGMYNPANATGFGDRTRPGSTMKIAITAGMRWDAHQESLQEGSLMKRWDAARTRWINLQ